MNTIAISAYLNKHLNPQHAYKTVHIGGSNGKGSTGYFLVQMLMQQGLKVGWYFSPYTMDRFDNIRIQDHVIDNVEDEFKQREQVMVDMGLTPFEQDTALALWMFKQHQVDIAVIEVGLGGTHDATNVLHATLAIITSTSLEHDEIIGPTIKDIATHQAGIIHPHMQVLLAPSIQGHIKKVFLDRINEVKATYMDLTQDLVSHDFPSYQQSNLSLAYQALKILIQKPKDIDIKSLKLMPFRFQYIHETLIFDGAHNLEGIVALIDALKQQSMKPVVYMSILKTKKYEAMIQHMLSYVTHVYVTSFDHEDSIKKEDIIHIKGVHFIEFDEMMHHLKNRNYDTILVTGSLYFLRSLTVALKSKGGNHER